ncbi:gustatory and odorant receptor 21a-like isoform X2 [Zootermopsis nevadensis]|uniref:gustatory and odorant receptor 21a-like isoform X2 n=1 Tax=Zootermopsis nevadensis TaxID=136037 RepID=UPI000B8E5F20|nr:gustatory and odorant receptor 21a-like isoform X2 [Zootermopsis nevadensis]
MDVTGEYLYIHRKIHPVKRTYPNTVVNVMSAKSPIAVDSLATSLMANEEYHKQISPAVNALRLLGMLPLEMSSDGVPSFRILSPIMAYSVCIYIFKMFTAYNMICTVVLPSFLRNDDFVNIIINWVSLIGLFILAFSSILMWLDSSKFILHMKKWSYFQNDEKQGNLSAYLIGEYRVLWLRLSQLASETGVVMGKATVFFLSLHLFALTMSLYGCLAGILTKGHSVMESAGLGIGFMFGAASLYGICSMAHETTATIGTEIQEQLQLMSSHSLRPETNIQVREFLQTISMNPPLISVLGFVVVNKGMAKSYASALVTYMIVLLQFNMGQPDGKCDCNVTHNGTEPRIIY